MRLVASDDATGRQQQLGLMVGMDVADGCWRPAFDGGTAHLGERDSQPVADQQEARSTRRRRNPVIAVMTYRS